MGFGIDEFSQGQSAVNGDEEKDSIYRQFKGLRDTACCSGSCVAIHLLST